MEASHLLFRPSQSIGERSINYQGIPTNEFLVHLTIQIHLSLHSTFTSAESITGALFIEWNIVRTILDLHLLGTEL